MGRCRNAVCAIIVAFVCRVQLRSQIVPDSREQTNKLYTAIRSFDVDGVRSILKNGADANVRNANRRNSVNSGGQRIFREVKSFGSSVVRLLLAAGADINARTSGDGVLPGQTALDESEQSEAGDRISAILRQRGAKRSQMVPCLAMLCHKWDVMDRLKHFTYREFTQNTLTLPWSILCGPLLNMVHHKNIETAGGLRHLKPGPMQIVQET